MVLDDRMEVRPYFWPEFSSFVGLILPVPFFCSCTVCWPLADTHRPSPVTHKGALPGSSPNRTPPDHKAPPSFAEAKQTRGSRAERWASSGCPSTGTTLAPGNAEVDVGQCERSVRPERLLDRGWLRSLTCQLWRSASGEGACHLSSAGQVVCSSCLPLQTGTGGSGERAEEHQKHQPNDARVGGEQGLLPALYFMWSSFPRKSPWPPRDSREGTALRWELGERVKLIPPIKRKKILRWWKEVITMSLSWLDSSLLHVLSSQDHTPRQEPQTLGQARFRSGLGAADPAFLAWQKEPCSLLPLVNLPLQGVKCGLGVVFVAEDD